MDFCIIHKIENIGGELKYSIVGYTTDSDDCDTINTNYESTLGQWFTDNKEAQENETITISDFFDTTPYVYVAKKETTSLDGLDLIEITDITTL